MHQDKALVLRAQLASIAVDIGERQRLTQAISQALREEVIDVGSTILNLTRHDNPDQYLKERVTLEEQRRGLSRELRDEQLSAWRDVQELHREQRVLEQELVQAGQRRQRLEDLTLAPGPL